MLTFAWDIMSEMRREYRSESLKERDLSEEKGLDGKPH
jgi:hypothetical protein